MTAREQIRNDFQARIDALRSATDGFIEMVLNSECRLAIDQYGLQVVTHECLVAELIPAFEILDATTSALDMRSAFMALLGQYKDRYTEGCVYIGRSKFRGATVDARQSALHNVIQMLTGAVQLLDGEDVDDEPINEISIEQVGSATL